MAWAIKVILRYEWGGGGGEGRRRPRPILGNTRDRRGGNSTSLRGVAAPPQVPPLVVEAVVVASLAGEEGSGG